MANFTQDRMYEMLGEISKKQKPNYRQGGSLNSYAKGGDSCAEGYVKDANGNCITQKQYNEQVAQQQLDESKEFTNQYFQSPMYNQMLQKSAGDDYESIKESREDNLENLSDVKYKDKPLRVGAIGYSNARNGSITLGQDALKNKGVTVHETAHSTDAPVNFFDKIFSPKTKRLIPESDKELIEGMVNKEFHKTPYFQENRSRIMDFGPEGFHEEKKAYDDYYKDYVGQPTETRARLMEIRKAASDAYQKDPNAMYDPFNQEVTPETYQKLLKHDYEPAKDENRKWEKKFATPLEELKGIYTDEEIMKLLNTVAENQSVNDRDPNMQTANTGGQMSKYAPGGVTADPPDWLTKRGANVYFNPMYQNNFTGSSSTLDKNALGTYRTSFSPVIGISGSLSKNRNAGDEKGRGWLYDAYAGLNPNAMKEGNFIPSAGVNFDWENSPQDKNFRPHVTLGADYNPDTGFNAAFSSGARIPFTPYGNKKIKPGYGLGHMDIYGGVRGGMDAEGEFSGGLTYGTRVHGKYMPKRNSLFGKVLGRNAYLYGEAGVNFDPQKGKFTEKEKPSTMVIATGEGLADRDIMSTSNGVRFGPTVYANVGVKKEIGDIKFKQDDRAKKIRDIKEKEKEVEYENYKQEEPEEEPKKEKSKKECPEGERRHCEDCPCEPIEKAKHPRWLREGGIVENEKVTFLNKFFRK